jgi:hypothetical protein
MGTDTQLLGELLYLDRYRVDAVLVVFVSRRPS